MIALVGGSGFIGSEIAKQLSRANIEIRNISLQKSLPQVQNVNLDIKNPLDPKVFAGVETVVHLAAIIREVGNQTFKNVNVGGTKNVCEAAKKAKVKSIIYFSNIGTKNNPAFPFLYSKWQAEQAVKASGLSFTILRPSIVFGEKDEFINKLATVAKLSPIVPILGNGQTRFAPIHASDVARLVLSIIKKNLFRGKIYEIGGIETLTYDEIVKIIVDKLGIKRIIIHLPIFLVRPSVALGAQILPNPPITTEQLKMVSMDNVPKGNAAESIFRLDFKKLADHIGYIRAQS